MSKSVFASRNRELVGLLCVILIACTAFSSLALARRSTWDYFDLLVPAILAVFFLVANLAMRIEAPRADSTLLVLTGFLLVTGLVVITSLDEGRGGTQLLWIAVGLGLMIVAVATLADYTWLSRYKYIIGITGLVFLVAPMLFGQSRGGARLWLSLGGYTFQPSEVAKLFLIIFFAAYLQEKREVLAAKRRGAAGSILPEAKHAGPLVLIWLVSLAILVFERDLGSSLLFFALFLGMLYAASGRGSYVLLGLILFLAGATFSYFLFSHVRDRVDIWLSPLPADVSGKVYQLAQSLFVMSAGGVGGTGLGEGLLGHKIAMPAVTTDFVFSAIGEQLGLAGTSALVLAYLYVIYRGVKISVSCRDDFGKLMAFGLTFALGVQVVVILGGVVKLIPLTGITLPFVSYGGSSIVANFVLIGALLAISNRAGEESDHPG